MGNLMPNKSRTWMEIDLDALRHNYRESEKLLKPGCHAMAIVKADSYGLGAVEASRALEKEGCSHFGVACMEEAMELRESGIASRLMTLAPVPAELIHVAIENDIEFPVTGLAQAKVCSVYGVATGKKPRVHIKLDVGLSRIGIVLANGFEAAKQEIRDIFSLPGLEVCAIMGHITGSMSLGGDEFNLAQLKLFDCMAKELKAEGYSFEKHCLSSIPLLLYPEYAYDYVRLGALLYGSLEIMPPFEFKPVVNLYTRIVQLKRVPAGTPVSYGPLFHTLRETDIATIAIGFSDGIRRSVIDKGFVLVNGCRARYIGKLCSDYSMLDVTDIPGVKEGDVAVIFGKSGGLTQGVEHYAEIYPASVSETTATLSRRISRFYVNKPTQQ